MKSLVKILSLVAFFVISTATAFAADSVMMYGKTTPVLISGVNNAGTIWFQNDGATVYLPAAVDQQAHLTPDPAVPGGYKIEGWAWSDNLGWVSFSCRGGKNPPTTGVACGGFDYGVKIDAAGVFHGYAWNDAMGYISMNSENHVPPALDGFGKPIVYGLKMSGAGAISGYAWSQSLGWLNFNGVYGRIKIEVSPITNTPEKCPSANAVGLCGCFGSNDPLGGDPSKLNPALDAGVPGAVKVADGFDKYVLSLYFKDENGVEIPAGQFGKDKPYEAKVFFNWEDTVRRNQTDASIATSGSDKISKPFQAQGSVGAILQKPVFLFTTDSPAAADSLFGILSSNEAGTPGDSKEALAAMTFNISSVAPTSKANVSKILNKNGVATGTVSNDDLSLVPGFAKAKLFKENPNYLQLDSIDWAIKNKTTGVTINGTSSFDDKHGTLEFKPALEVSKMTNSLSANTLWMFRNVPVGVGVEVKNNKPIPMGAVKYPDPSAVSELLVSGGKEFNTGFTKISLDGLKKASNIWQASDYSKITFPLAMVNSPNKFNASLEATLSEAVLSNSDSDPLPGNFAEGAGLYSKIFYNAEVFYGVDLVKNPITYFSNHLPRVVSTAVSNPSVVIQGTTYSQGQQVFSPQQGVSITGIGDQNVNIVRDLVYENIQKLLVDQTPPDAQASIEISSLTNPTCGAGCLKIDLEKETVYYYDVSDLIVENDDPEADLYVNKNTIFVVNGGNIHINNNIYPTEASTKNNRVGFVVFGDNKLYHGHAYIGPNVTNIRVLMIADGTLFSAENDFIPTELSYGEPNPIDPKTFNRQLLIEGGISTRNCIGCTDKADKYYSIPRNPLLEKTDANKEIVKKYDLNYLRYFSLQLQYDDDGNPIDQQKAGELGYGEIDPFNPVDNGGDLVPPVSPGGASLQSQGLKPEQTNPVYIKYLPPSPDSFVFSKEKSLTF